MEVKRTLGQDEQEPSGFSTSCVLAGRPPVVGAADGGRDLDGAWDAGDG